MRTAWTDNIDLGRFWTYAVPVATAALAASVLLLASTYLPGGPLVPQGVGLLLSLAIIPIHFGTVVSAIQLSNDGGRTSWNWLRAIFGGLSVVERVVLIGLVAVTSVVTWSSFFRAGGVPEEHDGRYFLNSHGDLTEISHERYDDVRRADLRDTTSIAVVFCATAVAAGLSYQRRRSRG